LETSTTFAIRRVLDWARHAQPARSLVEVLLDPAVRGALAPEEQALFHRDAADDRPPPAF
jgi:hypothetical protein